MRRIITVVICLVAISAVAMTYYVSRPARPRKAEYLSQEDVARIHRAQITWATEKTVATSVAAVPFQELVSETTTFAGFETNTDDTRRSYCVALFEEAGYDPIVTSSGVVLAVKPGDRSDYVAIGAHYDKVQGPSQGILDNMLGCVLVSNAAEVIRGEPTDFTYLFLCYGGEESGSKIGAATSAFRAGPNGRPTYVIEVDYVGDKGGGLGGGYLSPMSGRFRRTGIKISTYPMPEPRTIHTENDNIDNVDFRKAYLAYKTVISLVEGIEKGEGLNPPDTVNFCKKDKPLTGFQIPQTAPDRNNANDVP